LAKYRLVTENKKARPQDEPSSFSHFVRKHVAPLSLAFAETALMELRVKTAQGSITLVKSGPVAASETVGSLHTAATTESSEAAKPALRSAPAARVYNGEAGRAYVTINAEVVGIFRDVSEPPEPGEKFEAGRILGHIEALRLRNEVRCPVDCTLVAQVVVDGQPVDFGEALFVVDTGGVALPQAASVADGLESEEPIEPPRI
jgi:acetyl-CoA carboxylase biotin carboxyl carrier protein